MPDTDYQEVTAAGTHTNEETNRIEDINIHQADNGYTIHVGCKHFVFETKEKLIKKLSAYMDNPNKIRNEFIDSGKV